ncbi:MAG: hypothetical protein KF774_10515 [Planctomyces sp.]|nr:hypothetical protein [Planctomyces sp.]
MGVRMDYITLAFLLAIVGLALIFIELFVPSGGLIAILCMVAFIASVWCAYRGWWRESPGYFWSFTGGLVMIVPAFIFGLFRILETTQLGDRILLSAPRSEDVTPYQAEQERLSALIGQRGQALGMLNPGGLVRVGDQRLHAFTEGLVIDPEEWVEIVEVRGTRVVVRRAGDPAALLDERRVAAEPRPADELLNSADPSPPTQLDFELPQG